MVDPPLQASRRSAAAIIVRTLREKIRCNANLNDVDVDIADILIDRLFALGYPYISSAIVLGLTCKRINAIVQWHVRRQLDLFDHFMYATMNCSLRREQKLVKQNRVQINHLLGRRVGDFLRQRYPGVGFTIQRQTLCAMIRRTCQLCAAMKRPCFAFVEKEHKLTMKTMEWTFFVEADDITQGVKRVNLFCRNTCLERSCIRLCPRTLHAPESIIETPLHRSNPIIDRIQNCNLRARSGKIARNTTQLYPIMLAREMLIVREELTLATLPIGTRERHGLALCTIDIPGNRFLGAESLQRQLGICDLMMEQYKQKAMRNKRRMQRAENALLEVHVEDAIEDVLGVWSRVLGNVENDDSVISCEAVLKRVVRQMMQTHARVFRANGGLGESIDGSYPTLQGIVCLKNGPDWHTHMPFSRLCDNLDIFEQINSDYKVTDPHALLWASGALFASMPCCVGLFKRHRLIVKSQHKKYCVCVALHVAATLCHDDISVFVGTDGECRPYDLSGISMQMEQLLIELRRGPLTISCNLEFDAYENIAAVHNECAQALRSHHLNVPKLPSRWSWNTALRTDMQRTHHLNQRGFSCGEKVDRWAAVHMRRVALHRVCDYLRAMIDKLFTLGSAGRVLVLVLLRIDVTRVAEAVRRHHLTFMQGDVRRLQWLNGRQEFEFHDSLIMEM